MSEIDKNARVETLSDGRTIEVRELKGKHLMMAQQVTAGNSAGLMLALVALGTTIDGKQLIYEDLLEEDAFVVMEIMQVVMGDKVENFTSAMHAPSSTTGM